MARTLRSGSQAPRWAVKGAAAQSPYVTNLGIGQFGK